MQPGGGCTNTLHTTWTVVHTDSGHPLYAYRPSAAGEPRREWHGSGTWRTSSAGRLYYTRSGTGVGLSVPKVPVDLIIPGVAME